MSAAATDASKMPDTSAANTTNNRTNSDAASDNSASNGNHDIHSVQVKRASTDTRCITHGGSKSGDNRSATAVAAATSTRKRGSRGRGKSQGGDEMRRRVMR